MSEWMQELFGVKKPVIGMCHLHPLPGDPQFVAQKGLAWVYDRALDDLRALQAGGVDAVMFSNEFSLPYFNKGRNRHGGQYGACDRRIESGYQNHIRGERALGSGSLARPGSGNGRQVCKGDIYRRICKRLWDLEYKLRCSYPAPAHDRRSRCASAVQYRTQIGQLYGRT